MGTIVMTHEGKAATLSKETRLTVSRFFCHCYRKLGTWRQQHLKIAWLSLKELGLHCITALVTCAKDASD